MVQERTQVPQELRNLLLISKKTFFLLQLSFFLEVNELGLWNLLLVYGRFTDNV